MIDGYEVVQAPNWMEGYSNFASEVEANRYRFHCLCSHKKRQAAIDWITNNIHYPTPQELAGTHLAGGDNIAYLILRVEGDQRSHILTRRKNVAWPPQLQVQKVKALSQTKRKLW